MLDDMLVWRVRFVVIFAQMTVDLYLEKRSEHVYALWM